MIYTGGWHSQHTKRDRDATIFFIRTQHLVLMPILKRSFGPIHSRCFYTGSYKNDYRCILYRLAHANEENSRVNSLVVVRRYLEHFLVEWWEKRAELFFNLYNNIFTDSRKNSFCYKLWISSSGKQKLLDSCMTCRANIIHVPRATE